jgi:hypothetical protein
MSTLTAAVSFEGSFKVVDADAIAAARQAILRWRSLLNNRVSVFGDPLFGHFL